MIETNTHSSQNIYINDREKPVKYMAFDIDESMGFCNSGC